ncbi:N-6 DNA methylase [Thiomicrospira sp. XS5]|uniref:Eco57I restriction-modification methylase domain-containing protein n=1 Tax=Thiomicrospira sp. XS5 TaxID=1775636 RepID=UPI000749C32A|nr:N-6 DNA methylase [Thiomicrospira sp. XS5]KUJ75099.1 N-6 DNA methylase [Thiomicrospira sp. XS5]
MKKDIFQFLKSYSCGTNDINRLIVSSFVEENQISIINNRLINNLIIKAKDPDFEELQLFKSKFHIKSFEELITAFEYVISPVEKIITGAVYTPKVVRDFIVDSVTEKDDLLDAMFCDPACGCGGFLITAAQKIRQLRNIKYKEIFSNHIFGVDLQNYSIARSKILLSLLAIIEGEDEKEFVFNLYEGNSLEFDWNSVVNNFNGFDYIIGNPPYVCSRNIDQYSKSLLDNWQVSSTGHPDLYIPFFEIGMSLLKPSGSLGFITMNSFFKSLNGRALRSYFHNERFDFRILDFGGVQVFDSRSTYTCICFIENSKSDVVGYKKIGSLEVLNSVNLQYITYEELDDYNGWNFQNVDLVSKIERVGRPFSEVFKTSSGIATLKNNIYIIDYVDQDDDYFYLKCGAQIEKEVCKDIVNPNRLIKVKNLDSIKKKVIFPYRYIDDKPEIIPELEFKDSFPSTYNYLLSHKTILSQRDKGKGKYAEWFAYGRNQALEKYEYKLLFPHITPTTPNFILSNDDSLLFHNGMALIDKDKTKLTLAQKIMQSRLFWFYIVNTSKPYGSGYYSISKNYIKSFGIYDFSDEQISFIIKEKNKDKIDEMLEQLYGVDLGRQIPLFKSV